jgi:hypothetical protein
MEFEDSRQFPTQQVGFRHRVSERPLASATPTESGELVMP